MVTRLLPGIIWSQLSNQFQALEKPLLPRMRFSNLIFLPIEIHEPTSISCVIANRIFKHFYSETNYSKKSVYMMVLKIQTDSGFLLPEIQIRNSIKALFPDRDCFTLVRPLEAEQRLQHLDEIPVREYESTT